MCGSSAHTFLLLSYASKLLQTGEKCSCCEEWVFWLLLFTPNSCCLPGVSCSYADLSMVRAATDACSKIISLQRRLNPLARRDRIVSLGIFSKPMLDHFGLTWNGSKTLEGPGVYKKISGAHGSSSPDLGKLIFHESQVLGLKARPHGEKKTSWLGKKSTICCLRILDSSSVYPTSVLDLPSVSGVFHVFPRSI